jgi:glycosyltransferase involved in cell wall biosynthesis
MKNKIKISVIIPAYNEEKYLPLCLNSLAEQRYKPFEVIIVDNNSSDNTVSIVKNYKKIRNLKLVKSKSKLIGAIRQKGFRKAKGDILVSADADNFLPKNWLKNIIIYFKRHPKVVAVGGPYSFYDESFLIKHSRRAVTPFFLFIDSLLSGWRHHFAACNFAVRRNPFSKTGGFNTNLDFAEDVELAIRLRKLGRVEFIKSIFVLTSSRRYKKGIIRGIVKESVHSFLLYLKVIFLAKIIWPFKKAINS